MVQVELLVNTFYKKPLKPGDIIEVDAGVAERWERNRIAIIVSGVPAAETDPNGEIEDDRPDVEYTIADLREIAESNGIDITGLRKKADIIAALQAAGLPI
ncbi:SAP domain-containing protein [Paenibacillus sp. 32O-W]|uniref:SAP domain-containing protein n=1 Tax=Paenibacillus sp. 32O-W TaxID=1695218 RepID=UPI00078547ED|nr:SAP domain-containing protein [Paenibacillus sp. 32O-W]